MMVKPTVAELLTKANNRYELVIATARRARQIAAGAEPKNRSKRRITCNTCCKRNCRRKSIYSRRTRR